MPGIARNSSVVVGLSVASLTRTALFAIMYTGILFFRAILYLRERSRDKRAISVIIFPSGSVTTINPSFSINCSVYLTRFSAFLGYADDEFLFFTFSTGVICGGVVVSFIWGDFE